MNNRYSLQRPTRFRLIGNTVNFSFSHARIMFNFKTGERARFITAKTSKINDRANVRSAMCQ